MLQIDNGVSSRISIAINLFKQKKDWFLSFILSIKHTKRAIFLIGLLIGSLRSLFVIVVDDMKPRQQALRSIDA